MAFADWGRGMGLFGKLTPPRLLPVHRADDPAADVIFVHGLDGDAMASWRFDLTQ